MCEEQLCVQQAGPDAPSFLQARIIGMGIELLDISQVDLRQPINSIFTGKDLNPIQHFFRQIGASIRKNSKRHSNTPFVYTFIL